MTEKTADSLYSDLDLEDEMQHVTLARALEESSAARDTCLQIKNDLLGELERFRIAMRAEYKARNQKLDLNDWLMVAGLSFTSLGIAVAFHWAYSLIVIGSVLVSVSALPLLRRPFKAG